MSSIRRVSDLLVVPNRVLRLREDIVDRLLLAVEAISPSSARYDRVKKRPAYQRNLVPEYWIVDERSGTVERWHHDDERPELISEHLVRNPEGATIRAGSRSVLCGDRSA